MTPRKTNIDISDDDSTSTDETNNLDTSALSANDLDTEKAERSETNNEHNHSPVSLTDVDSLLGRRRRCTLPLEQKVKPAILLLLHHSKSPMQLMLAKNWCKRLGYVYIDINHTTTTLAIEALNNMEVPHGINIEVILFELNYSDVGGQVPNYELIKALTSLEKIEPKFLVGCCNTAECINNLNNNDEYKDKVKAVEFGFAALEEIVKKNTQPRKHSYQP